MVLGLLSQRSTRLPLTSRQTGHFLKYRQEKEKTENPNALPLENPENVIRSLTIVILKRLQTTRGEQKHKFNPLKILENEVCSLGTTL